MARRRIGQESFGFGDGRRGGVSSLDDLASAIRYALARMQRMRPYLANGILELDTDVAEHPLSHPFCGFGGLSLQASTMAA